jgi:signal transduction histidine kinase/ligand-binding sensor domain-containing protein
MPRPGAIAAFLLLFSFALSSGPEALGTEPLLSLRSSGTTPSFRWLGTDEGLSSDSVFCMLQDRRGFMWLGTFSGLDRYDGSKVLSYRPVPGDRGSLSASLIFDLHQDAAGDIWIATDGGGLDRYRESTDSFEHFRNSPSEPESLAGDRVFAVVDDSEGTIWAGLGGAGLDRLDRSTGGFRHYRHSADPRSLPDDTVRTILADSRGRLWVGTVSGLALYATASDDFSPVGQRELGQATIRALFEDSAGNIWIGTENRGLFRIDANNPETDSSLSASPEASPDPRRIPLPAGMETVTVRAVAEDAAGRLWIGTEDRGLVLLGKDSGAASLVRAAPGNPRALSHDNIRSIIADRGGLVWIGTRGGGVSINNPRSLAILHYPSSLVPEGAKAELRQIYEDRAKGLWFASDGAGLVRFDRASGKIERYRHSASDPRSIPGDRVVSLVEDRQGGIWVGTDGSGLGRLDPATGKFRNYRQDRNDPSSLGGSVVWSLLVDRQGVLWIGMEGSGLDRYDRQRDSFVHYTARPGDPDSLQGYSVRALLEDSRGRFWVGTWDGGLSLFDREKGSMKPIRRSPGDPSALADSSVTCLYEDASAQIWVGTGGGGLDRLTEREGSIHFEHLRAEDGLSGNDIVGILEDRLKRLWIITGSGLTRYDPDRRNLQKWSEANGFQRRFSQNSWLHSSDGYFFLGGSEGLDVVRPEDLVHDSPPPPVVIADIEVIGGRSLDPAATSMRSRSLRRALAEGVLTMRPEDSAVVVDFAVLDYTDPAHNRYSFSLKGARGNWNDLGSSSRAVLTGLGPGEHTLRIRGADSGGVWNDEGASLRIKVIPPVWRQTWFIGLAAILVVLGVLAGVRLRTSSLERRARELGDLSMHIQDAREEERAAAARDVHDELGQLLTAVKMDLHWLKRHPGEANRDARLGESLELVDEAMESVKRISTRLRPKALDTLTLSEALSWQLEEFRRRTGIECLADIGPSTGGIDPATATTLFRVFQEILTNIARHAQASQVKVSFSHPEASLVLEVSDDGVGLPAGASSVPGSIGILGMRERVRYCGGEFKIESDRGSGTVISVRLPSRAPQEGRSV